MKIEFLKAIYNTTIRVIFTTAAGMGGGILVCFHQTKRILISLNTLVEITVRISPLNFSVNWCVRFY